MKGPTLSRLLSYTCLDGAVLLVSTHISLHCTALYLRLYWGHCSPHSTHHSDRSHSPPSQDHLRQSLLLPPTSTSPQPDHTISSYIHIITRQCSRRSRRVYKRVEVATLCSYSLSHYHISPPISCLPACSPQYSTQFSSSKPPPDSRGQRDFIELDTSYIDHSHRHNTNTVYLFISPSVSQDRKSVV